MSKVKDDLRIEAFAGADGLLGCGMVDLRESPPRGVFMVVDADGRIAARRVWYREGLHDGATVPRLAAAAFADGAEHELLPASEALETFGLRLQSAEEFEVVAAGDLAPVRDRLRPEAIRALRATDNFVQSEYAFYAAAGPRGERRRQAADVYPLLAGVMARQPILKMAIDMGKPLNEALQKVFGVDEGGRPRLGKGILKRLQGVDWPTGGVTPERIGAALAGLPPDWFPRNREDWDAFCVIADTVGRVLPDVTGSRLEDLCAGCGGKWSEYARRLAKAYADTRPPLDMPEEQVAEWLKNLPQPDTGREAIRNACLDVEDMTASFARMIVIPVAANASGEETVYLSDVHGTQATTAAARILFAGKSAGPVFELSRHWHTQREQIENAAQEGEDPEPEVVFVKQVAEDGWAPLCNAVQAPNGVWITPLTDPGELRDEGSQKMDGNGVPGLQHCVGGYTAGCRNGRSHILSLREIYEGGGYRRLSTVEFESIAQGDAVLRQRQHRGECNRTPPPNAQAALDWFVREVRNQSIPLNYEGIRSYLGTVHQRTDDVKLACGYDWTDQENILKAMRPWGPYVGKSYRRMGFEDFAAVPEVHDVVETIAPSFTSRRMP